jgi:hypothetical protein
MERMEELHSSPTKQVNMSNNMESPYERLSLARYIDRNFSLMALSLALESQ